MTSPKGGGDFIFFQKIPHKQVTAFMKHRAEMKNEDKMNGFFNKDKKLL